VLAVSEQSGIVELSAAEPVAAREIGGLAAELIEACRRLAERPDPLTAVVLRGGSDGFFVRAPSNSGDCDAAGAVWLEATSLVARLAPPVVVVLDGPAIGPAWELALAGDLRLAVNDATVGSPEIRWGRMPGAGGLQRLVRAAGRAAATEALMFGQLMGAEEARKRGFIHYCGSQLDVQSRLAAILASLRASAPNALAYAKETGRVAGDLSLEAGLRLEADLTGLLQTTADRAEGLAAFQARRPPHFGGT
jgi:enoyl-CoA hydratase